MKINKISNTEFERSSISSLPVRPNRNSKYGSEGMSAEQLKAAFDKNSGLLRDKVNALIDTLYNSDLDLNIAGEMPTGIEDLPTLKDFFHSVEDGTLATKIKLTDEYNLLNFATKIMSILFPERAIEFIKVKKQNGAYTLPSVPYAGHEEAIYLMPSNSSMTLFNSYIWNGVSWELWGSGSLENYFDSLSSYIEELREDMASKEDINILERTKADLTDLYEIKSLHFSSFNGSPFTYNGDLEDIELDSSVDKNRIYLICNKASSSFGYWCYYDRSNWKIGGKYLADSSVSADINAFQTLPVESRAVKAYVDSCLSQVFRRIADDRSGFNNLFDANAVEEGCIDPLGRVVANQNYITTDFLSVRTAIRLICTCRISGQGDGSAWVPSAYCLYTSSKTAILGSAVVLPSTPLDHRIDIDHTNFTNANFIRISFKKSEYQNTTRHMIERGFIVSEYTPYYDFQLKIDTEMSSESELPVQNKVITDYVNSKTHSLQWMLDRSEGYPKFDTANQRLILNPSLSTECGFFLDGELYRFNNTSLIEIDISPVATLDKNGQECNAGKICINTSLLKSFTPDTPSDLSSVFTVHGANSQLPSGHYLPIATFNRNESAFSAWMNCPFIIDDKIYGESYTTEALEELLSNLTPKDSPEIIARADEITAALEKVSEDDSIRFAISYMSDTENTEKALALCRNVSKKCDIAFLGLCGIDSSVEELRQISEKKSTIPILATFGEGDKGFRDSSIGTLPNGKKILPSADFVSNKEYRDVLYSLKRDRKVVYDSSNPSSPYFYTDFDEACIRVLFINTADLPETKIILAEKTSYTDNNGLSATLPTKLEIQEYDNQTLPDVSYSQLEFIAQSAMDFSDKPNFLNWRIITVQFTANGDWTADGFKDTHINTNKESLEGLLSAFTRKEKVLLSNPLSPEEQISKSYLGKSGDIISGIYSARSGICSAIKDNILRIGCPPSCVPNEATGNAAPICEFFSISRKTGKIDIIRGAADDNVSISFSPSVPEKAIKDITYHDDTGSLSTTIMTKESHFLREIATLEDGTPSLSVNVLHYNRYDFEASLTITPKEYSYEFSYPANVLFSGADVSYGRFAPKENRGYTIKFWYDGCLNGHVRAIEI